MEDDDKAFDEWLDSLSGEEIVDLIKKLVSRYPHLDSEIRAYARQMVQVHPEWFILDGDEGYK